jgi:hypothetical protein
MASLPAGRGGGDALGEPAAAGPRPGFSLRQTTGWVSLLEIAELSNPGVHYRLKRAVAFLAALVGRLPGGETHPAPFCAAPAERFVWPTAPASANPPERDGLEPGGRFRIGVYAATGINTFMPRTGLCRARRSLRVARATQLVEAMSEFYSSF